MKGIVSLKEKDELDFHKYDIFEEISLYDYRIVISLDKLESLDSLLNTSGDMNDAIEVSLYSLEGDNSEFAINVRNFLNSIKGNEISLLKNAQYLEINYPLETVFEYIKSNPIIKTKKLVFHDAPLDINFINILKSNISEEVLNNSFYMIEGNCDLVDFKTYESTVKNIYEYYLEIKNLNLSKIEKIMYAYDIVRNRVYKMENSDEDLSISRSLSNVLLGDKIVCVGYSKMFKALLSMLNINVEEVFLEGDINHERTLIYVKDDKYNIDGVYYFDSTWDSKRKEEDNTYLYSYKYFAKTKSYFEEKEKKKNTSDTKIAKFDIELATKFKEIYLNKGIDYVPKKMIDQINFMSKVVNGEYLLTAFYLNSKSPFYKKIDLDKVVKEIDRLNNLFNKEIDAETFLKVLFNVRKLRYYKEQKSCPFNVDAFYNTAVISEWNFSRIDEDLLYFIFQDDRFKATYKDKMINFLRETNMARDMKRIDANYHLKFRFWYKTGIKFDYSL